jgi:hypothetical protein
MTYLQVLLLLAFLLLASVPVAVGVFFLYLAKPLSTGLARKHHWSYKFMVFLFRVLGVAVAVEGLHYMITRLLSFYHLWKSH